MTPLRALLRVSQSAQARGDLDTLLSEVASTTCEALGYGTAVVNIYQAADENLRVAAVHGSRTAERALLGTVSSLDQWHRLLDAGSQLAPEVCFVASGTVDWREAITSHIPHDLPQGDGTGAWRPEDALFAVLRDSAGVLLGILSLDEPLSGRRPDRHVAQALSAVAAHLAHALELRRAGELEARRTAALERLAAMAAAAHHDLALDELAALIVQTVGDALKFADVEVALHDPSGGLSSRASTGARCLDGVSASAALGWLDGDADGLVLTDLGQAASPPASPGSSPYGFPGSHVLVGLGWQDDCLTGILRASHPDDRLRPGPAICALLRAFAQQAGAMTRSVHLRSERDRERGVARRDDVTGLPNHVALTERITAAGERWAAVACIGLDDVAQVSSSVGHGAADGLLRSVAARLLAAAPPAAMVARVGGEAFAVLLGEPGTVVGDVQQLQDALAAPIEVAGVPIHVDAAAGVALAGTADALRCAHQAMVDGRRSPARCAVYDAAHDRSRRQLELASALHEAVARHEFQLHFQPLYGLDDERLVGLEALLRWTHRGMSISPAEFIPLAEQSGAIEHIGAWVLDRACGQIAAWMDAGLPCPVVGVNVAPRQLERTDLLATVLEALERHHVPADRLCVEITESTVMAGSRTSDFIEALARAGVRCAIDDFGAGHSSLARLSSLPVGMVKFDRQFLTGVPGDARATRLLEAFLSVAARLDLKTVVEGIETPEQAALCAAAGADIGQGFLLGRPGPAADTTRLLQRRAVGLALPA